MRKILILFLASALLCGCGSSRRAVEIVHDIQRDTLYISQTQYDSIYVFQDKYVDRSRDTLYIKDKSVEFRYKYLHDTTYIHKVDTIPVIKEVEVTKEVRYTPWYAKTLAWIGVAAILLLILLTLKKIYLK